MEMEQEECKLSGIWRTCLTQCFQNLSYLIDVNYRTDQSDIQVISRQHEQVFTLYEYFGHA